MGTPSIQGSELEKALLLNAIGRQNLTKKYALNIILNGDDSLIQRYRDHTYDTSSKAQFHILLLEDLESGGLTIKQVAGLLLIPHNLHATRN
jgi:hypothetical protein